MKIPFFSLLLAAWLLSAGCSNKSVSAGNPGGGGGGKKGGGDVPVTVAKVTQREVPVDLQVIGNVEAYSTITVRAQVTGEVLRAPLQEGEYVKKGDLLFTIDKRLVESELRQMEANLLRQTAMLRQMEANLARDQAQLKYVEVQGTRYTKMLEQGLVSKEQADQQTTSVNVAKQTVAADEAAVESAKAEIAASRANLENSRVKLSYSDIRSPIDGRTGNILVKQGNLVSAGTMDMVTINQVKPLYVTFSVPESQLPDIKRYMAAGSLAVHATPQNEEGTETGSLTFVDNSVDTTSGTIKLKGTFPNTDLKLWPGQFVRVVLRLTTIPNALVVPNQAVQTGQQGPYVYVVKEDRSVESRNVKTGARVEQDLVIEDGLTVGETVVLEGQLRLAPGMKIQVRDPSGAPARKKRAS